MQGKQQTHTAVSTFSSSVIITTCRQCVLAKWLEWSMRSRHGKQKSTCFNRIMNATLRHNSLTPQYKVILENLIVAQLVKKQKWLSLCAFLLSVVLMSYLWPWRKLLCLPGKLFTQIPRLDASYWLSHVISYSPLLCSVSIQSVSWFTHFQSIWRFFRNEIPIHMQKVTTIFQRNPPLNPILSQFNSVHISIPCYSDMARSFTRN
jgi:hypothetical protein